MSQIKKLLKEKPELVREALTRHATEMAVSTLFGQLPNNHIDPAHKEKTFNDISDIFRKSYAKKSRKFLAMSMHELKLEKRVIIELQADPVLVTAIPNI